MIRGVPARLAAAALLVPTALTVSPASFGAEEVDLSETPIPFLKSEDLPPRVGALIEIGRGINEVGELEPGIELPTGAVWQPAFWGYGSLRMHALATDGNLRIPAGSGSGESAEVAARLDLFGNLQLSGTERVHMHVRPLDGDGMFTGRTLEPESDGHKVTDFEIETLFFEGDFGEMFPRIDPEDRMQLDLGVGIGKFPVEFQNGYLIRDEIASFGLSKTNVQFPGSAGLRVLGIWGFDNINEANGGNDQRSTKLALLSVEGDFPWGLLELDVGKTFGDRIRGDQVNAGIGWTHHFAGNNFSIHANYSQHGNQLVRQAQTEERVSTVAGAMVTSIVTTAAPVNVRPNGQPKDYDGGLVVASYSTEVTPAHDILYASGYWAQGDFARLASNGTPPLGPVGLSFAGVGMGSYRPALWPRPLDSFGYAVGAQFFFDDEFGNLAVEFAQRHDLEDGDEFGETGGSAITMRYQQKFANRFLLQVDAYRAWLKGRAAGFQDRDDDDDSAALRVELRMNF